MISESLIKKIETTLKGKLTDSSTENAKEKAIAKEKTERESVEMEELKTTTMEFVSRFNLEMFELGLYNSFNKTYKITGIEKTPYGFNASISLVPGLNFIKLREKLSGLQQSLNCILILENKTNKNIGILKVILKDVDTSIPFTPQKLKPNEIFLGMSFTNEPIIIDCNKVCMFLIAGATGTGKTRYLYTILLSWLMSCSEKEIGLFLADLAKSEFCSFRDVKQVTAYAEELSELLLITEYLNKEMDRRKKVLSKYRYRGEGQASATNIEEYNAIEPDKKMKFQFIFIDEFSTLNPDATDTEEEKNMKERILAVIKRISKQGRSLGIFCILATQKTTKDEIPPILKNMSAVRISFRANDAISSEVILGDNCAVGLDDRIGLYSLNGGADKDYLFSASLDINDMNKIIRQHIDRGRKKESLEMMIKTLELREAQLDKIYKLQEKEKEKKKNNVLSESSNLMRKPVITYEIQDYSKMNVVKESKASYIPPRVEAKKPPKNGWYALENERKKLNKK